MSKAEKIAKLIAMECFKTCDRKTQIEMAKLTWQQWLKVAEKIEEMGGD
jgi:hypothetical protein